MRLSSRLLDGARRLPLPLVPLVQRAQWQVSVHGVNNIEKRFEFKSGAVASQFVSQVKDVALRVRSTSIGIDATHGPSVIRLRIPSEEGVHGDLDAVCDAAHLVDDAAAELQLAGGWK